jgi:hypothetical protein
MAKLSATTLSFMMSEALDSIRTAPLPNDPASAAAAEPADRNLAQSIRWPSYGLAHLFSPSLEQEREGAWLLMAKYKTYLLACQPSGQDGIQKSRPQVGWLILN